MFADYYKNKEIDAKKEAEAKAKAKAEQSKAKQETRHVVFILVLSSHQRAIQ